MAIIEGWPFLRSFVLRNNILNGDAIGTKVSGHYRRGGHASIQCLKCIKLIRNVERPIMTDSHIFLLCILIRYHNKHSILYRNFFLYILFSGIIIMHRVLYKYLSFSLSLSDTDRLQTSREIKIAKYFLPTSTVYKVEIHYIKFHHSVSENIFLHYCKTCAILQSN